VQNLMLAAGSGLGTTLTTLHKFHEEEVKQLLAYRSTSRRWR